MLSIRKKKFGLQCPRRKNGQIFVFRIIVAAFFQTRKHQAFCKSKQSNNKSCDALRDLVRFLQFKRSERHPWRSVYFN